MLEHENTDSDGIWIEGGAGAWTLLVAEPGFVSARLRRIPNSLSSKKLTIIMRNHRVDVVPAGGLRASQPKRWRSLPAGPATERRDSADDVRRSRG